MIYVRLFQRYAVLTLLALGLGLLTGCTDQMLTETPSSPEATSDAPTASDSKLRHAHLFSRTSDGASKRILERYEDISTDTEFILGLFDTTLDPQRVLERYENAPGITVKRIFEAATSGFSVHVDANKVKKFLVDIENDNDIEWVEPDPTIQRADPAPTTNYGSGEYMPWGVDQIDAEVFTQLGDDDATLAHYTQRVHVFVLDSGIENLDVNVCETRSFLANGATGDNIGHGTHIAGTIGAKDNLEGIQGVAPNACLHDYRVTNNAGVTKLSTVVDAVDHITALKQAYPDWPMVVNISLGVDVGTTEYNALDEAIQASINAGVTYVLAAGNDAIDASTVTPAHVGDAITVAAHDTEAVFARFSNHGALIDLAAPGVDVMSLPNMTATKTDLSEMSGTSMAASHVSGAAALYLALKNPWAAPAEVQNALRSLSNQTVTGAPDATTTKRLHVGDLRYQLDDDLFDSDDDDSDDDDSDDDD
jgi:subtilisin family serine protease